MTWRKIALLCVSIALSVGVIALIVSADDLVALQAAFSEATMLPLLLALACVPVVQYRRAWRFSAMLTGGFYPPEFVIFRMSVLLVCFNYLLPFRV